jgi:hypothetical protein
MEEIKGNPLNTNWNDLYLDCFFSMKDKEDYLKYKSSTNVYDNEDRAYKRREEGK